MTFTAKGTPQERFWARVEKRSPQECWPWTGARNGNGYGRMKIDGQLYLAHRLAYEFAKRPLKDNGDYHGAVVRHTCDNPTCCNPAHLVRGDQRKNVADMVKRGRGTLAPPFRAKAVPDDK